MTDTCSAEATLDTVFRPHEVLFHALDTLEDLGILTLHSDHDVTAARLLAALDDVGTTVTAYEEDTEPDGQPRGPVYADDLWSIVLRESTKQMNDRIDAKVNEPDREKPSGEPAPEVCPFLIPFIKSDPWWKDGDTYELGGMQFAVIRGGK